MSVDLKEKVRKIVQQRNLCSYMNNTKWNELRTAMMTERPFSQPYLLKFVFEDEDAGNKGGYTDVYYLGDWYSIFAIDGVYCIYGYR